MIKITKKTQKSTCWACKGKGCKVCHFTGMWNEDIYYHIYTGKDGKKYCIDGDTIK
jgi:hypothetical protein